MATETLLADFLREIREVSSYRRRTEDKPHSIRTEREINGIPEAEDIEEKDSIDLAPVKEGLSEIDFSDTGRRSCFIQFMCHILTNPSVWHPGQGVNIDFPAIIEILIEQMNGERELLFGISPDFTSHPSQTTKFNNRRLSGG